MTPSEEAACIVTLRSLLQQKVDPSEIRRRCSEMSAGYLPEVRRGRALYDRVLRRRDPKLRVPVSFAREHLEAYQDFLLAAARGQQSQTPLPACTAGDKKLLLTWHFPELNSWLAQAPLLNITALVPRQIDWMEEITGPGVFLNYRKDRWGLALARAFHRGRRIFSTFDYCSAELQHIVSDFLGFPARTITGLLELAERSDYEVHFLTQRDGAAEVTETLHPASDGIEECAKRLNRAVENEILATPPRWLVWPVADHRWIEAGEDLAQSQPLTAADPARGAGRA